MENTKTMERSVIDFSKKSEIIQTILIWVLALVVPTFLGSLIKEVFGAQSVIAQNSQVIVGTTVNTLLILSALNLKGFGKIAAVVTAPSVSTILSGFVFKSASVFMAWMIPAIWIGNFALIYAYKLIMLAKNKNDTIVMWTEKEEYVNEFVTKKEIKKVIAAYFKFFYLKK